MAKFNTRIFTLNNFTKNVFLGLGIAAGGLLFAAILPTVRNAFNSVRTAFA